jgi:YD repeat-containing protein
MSLPNGDQVLRTTTNYRPDGRILEERRANPDGSEWVTSYNYRPDGRLLKTINGNGAAKESSETIYSYDEEGRLVEVKSGGKIHTRYRYDDKGNKTALETFDPQPLLENAAYAPFWEGTEMGFAPAPGGSVTTLYNEQGTATGAQFHDAEGNLIGHIVRKFDTEGRVTAEQQAADAPQVNLPEELRSKLNPEQLKSVGAMMAGAQNRAISYSYDVQARVRERRRSGGPLGEQVTVTTYNDHGDKASERETIVMSTDTGPWNLTEAGAFIPAGKPNPPQPPLASETQYTYQYDTYGNWTEQNVASRPQPDEAFRPGTVVRRKVYYY